MSVFRLYVDSFDMRLRQIGEASWLRCKIDLGLLMVYSKNACKIMRVEYGEIYDIKYDEERLLGIYRVARPKQQKDVLMWLLGYVSYERYPGWRSYARAVDKWRDKNGGWNHVIEHWSDCSLDGDGYGFCQYISKVDGRIFRVAAYIDGKRRADKALVKEVFCRYPSEIFFPRPYVEKILRDVFNFTKADLAELDTVKWQ